MNIFFIVTTMLLLIVSLLPLSRNPHWFVRGMDFPRLQLAIISFLLLIAIIINLDFSALLAWLLLGTVAACLLWQVWWILPYTRIWPSEVRTAEYYDDERKLSIITANVLTPNRQADKLLNLVRQHQPDVLVTLESNDWWQQQLDTLQDEMPYSIKCPQNNLYGMHVYSRLALDCTEISYLVEDDIPSIHTQVTLRSGDTVRMHFLHPAPPSPTENTESAERDAELVIVARSVKKSQQPIVVTGDLNDVAWSATTRLFRKLSGLLDPRVGRGMFNTFHAKIPLLRWPLDHLFHSHHFSVHSINRLAYFGSDHFALFTELSYTPVQDKEQQGLDTEPDDKSWGDSIVKKQDVSAKDVTKPGESSKY